MCDMDTVFEQISPPHGVLLCSFVFELLLTRRLGSGQAESFNSDVVALKSSRETRRLSTFVSTLALPSTGRASLEPFAVGLSAPGINSEGGFTFDGLGSPRLWSSFASMLDTMIYGMIGGCESDPVRDVPSSIEPLGFSKSQSMVLHR